MICCACATIHILIDDNIGDNIILKLDIYKERFIEHTLYPFFVDNISTKDHSLVIREGDNIYEIVNKFCTYHDLDIYDCIKLIQYCKEKKRPAEIQSKKHAYLFVIATFPFYETIGGIVVAHYLIDRLNYYFASHADPIAYIMPIIEAHDNNTWDMYYVNPKYNTPKMTKLQYGSDDDLIVIYPETIQGNHANKKMIVRWILYFLHLENKTIEQSSYQYQSDDYIACYSQGICTQFDDDNWHKHPLRVIDLNWDMFDSIDPNRIRDIDVVYFKPLDRKRTWIDRTGRKIILDYDNYEYMLKNSFALMNRTLTRMDASLRKQERIDLLSRSTYFISFDPATFRSVEAAMVGCLSIVIPVPGVDKSEWASVSYAPEYLQYGIAYGFDDLDHARSTIGLVLHNLHEQDRKTRVTLVNFIKDIKRYFNLDPDFLKDKLE